MDYLVINSKIKMKPSIICLTPVRNEAWILDRFLKAASLWADYIIIADQMSTDGSRQIAMNYPKVMLIDNNSESFNEPERQKLLIKEARKIKGPRLLITLDADEMFTPNVFNSDEWNLMLQAKPGTIFKFQWANIRPDFKTMWLSEFFHWGYMDDGYEHTSINKIHSARIPLPSGHDEVSIASVKILHFQYTAWERMKSKQRWYQCLEKINDPQKSALDLFRQYHHMDTIPQNEIISIPKEWFQEYKVFGIDLTERNLETKNWFDIEVLNMIEKFGKNVFKKLMIWDINWVDIAQLYNKQLINQFKDPRNSIDKSIQKWMMKTQNKLDKLRYRRIDRLIKYIFNY